MLEINISEFIDFDLEALKDYLSLHGETDFRVIFPKGALEPGLDKYIIYWMYYMAAYSGQKIYEISSVFEYFTPSEYSDRDFIFDVLIENMDKFADVLFMIINGFYHENEVYNNFHDEGTVFYESAMQEKINPATWGLLRIADKYLE